MALKLKGVTCSKNTDVDNAWKIGRNDIINGGCDKDACYWYDNVDKMLSNCRSSQADMVFMFLLVVVLAASALLTFLRMRKGY